MEPPSTRLYSTATWAARWTARVTGGMLIATSMAVAEPRSQDDVRSAVAAQIAAQRESVANAIASVDNKLRDGDVARAHRLAAAARILRGRLQQGASADQQLVAARRVAAAKLLLYRDAAERRLLLTELTQLRADTHRIAGTAAQAADIPLPTQLFRPSRGPIRGRFGAYVHDSTKLTLSRRGIDFEVQPRSWVAAPADGVVRFAGAIRGFDRGVIIDHGHFLSVVARLRDATVSVGTRVSEGDYVGSALDRRVYFEVRIKVGPGGLPIDPAPLLVGGR